MNPSDLNDLLRRHRRDERRQTLAALVEACEPLVRSVCRRHLRDAPDVDDAVQETLARLTVRSADVHGDLTAWVCRVARSVCVDVIRGQARQRRHVAKFPKPRCATPPRARPKTPPSAGSAPPSPTSTPPRSA